MSVRTEHNGPITTVILHRLNHRNAVDRDTAYALTAAFEDFDNDPSQQIAVLWGRAEFFAPVRT